MNKVSRVLWFVLLLSAAFFGFSLFQLFTAHASGQTLVAQTDQSTATTTNAYAVGGSYVYTLPTNISGVLESVSVSLSSDNGTQTFDVYPVCFTDAAHTTPCPEWGHAGNGTMYSDGGAQNVAQATSPTIHTFNYTTDTVAERTMTADRFYTLYLIPSSPAHEYVWGDAAGDPYYVVQGASTDNTTRIIAVISPTNGATVPGNTVTFSFEYWFNSASSTENVAGLSLNDVTTGQTIVAPPDAPILADGQSTYTGTSTLTFGHSYTWTPYLEATTTGTYLYGSTVYFSVNSLSGAASTTVPTAFQGLWNAIQNNPPFGFIFQIKAQLDSLSATGTPTTTLDLPTFEVNDIFSPFDTGLAGIMYLVFAVWLIKRFAHFEF